MTTMATYMARLGRIGRINKHEWHTRRLRFVGHKLPQLVKAPTVVAGAVRLADFGALANARQVFQGKLARGRLCSLDKLLADRVVDRSHMACLSAGQPFQKPRGFFRAFALERTPDFGIAGTQTVDRGRLVHGGIRIHRHAPSAEINP